MACPLVCPYYLWLYGGILSIWRHKKGLNPYDLSLLSSYGVMLLHMNLYKWWGRRDSNSYTSRRQNLNLVRLPISPRPQRRVSYQVHNQQDSTNKSLLFILK